MDEKFVSLVLFLRFQVELALGFYGAPDGKEVPEPQFEIARHFLDLLSGLQEKTKGNLNLEEERALNNNLTELRFRYVQAFEESKKKPQAEEAKPAEAQPAAEQEQQSS
jgi:uncharacterized protein DUF1844